MSQVLNAVEAFLGHLSAIAWSSLALALACHVAKLFARTRAWRGIIAAAYPGTRVRSRTVLGAYLAGAGVNALVPARGGDLLKLYLVKHRVEGATYPTLGATLLLEAVFDAVVATLLLLWALQQGVFPSLDVLPDLPGVDWGYLFRHPELAAALGVFALVAAFLLGVWAAPRVSAFRTRVRQGFAVLADPWRYLRGVVAWQALDWMLRIATLLLFLDAFGIGADLRDAFLVQAAESLSTVLPLTPGGIGTEQALLVYVLRGEASTSALLSFSVGMKISLIVVNVALGMAALALMLRTLRFRRLLERERQAVRVSES
ncbi:MAG: flippase-like domain-containing protein [Actinobacteria bacterium]|nr:flippase-like domain-containing protein [Actinomycetota bacterium]